MRSVGLRAAAQHSLHRADRSDWVRISTSRDGTAADTAATGDGTASSRKLPGCERLAYQIWLAYRAVRNAIEAAPDSSETTSYLRELWSG
jgi:hypothetical protein